MKWEKLDDGEIVWDDVKGVEKGVVDYEEGTWRDISSSAVSMRGLMG